MLPAGFYTQKTALSEEKTVFGAGNVTRTHDLLITNQLLYRLSYTSKLPEHSSTSFAFRQWEICISALFVTIWQNPNFFGGFLHNE